MLEAKYETLSTECIATSDVSLNLMKLKINIYVKILISCQHNSDKLPNCPLHRLCQIRIFSKQWFYFILSDVRGWGGLAAATEVVQKSPLCDDFKITTTINMVDLIKKNIRIESIIYWPKSNLSAWHICKALYLFRSNKTYSDL